MRPTLFSPQLAATVIRVVAAGGSLAAAAAVAGVALSTLTAWRNRGASELEALPPELRPSLTPEPPRRRRVSGVTSAKRRARRLPPAAAPTTLAGFVVELDRARGEVELDATARIFAAGKRDWKALAWLLERGTHPGTWGAHSNLHVQQRPADDMPTDAILAELRDLGFVRTGASAADASYAGANGADESGLALAAGISDAKYEDTNEPGGRS